MTYADRDTEQRLVSAVKEAAARIDYNTVDDPEAVLARALSDQGLSARFAKTATDQLNKSYSVHYMSTHTDEDRANDHPLLDYKKVEIKMAPESNSVCLVSDKREQDYAKLTVGEVIPKQASTKEAERSPKTFDTFDDYLHHLTGSMDKVAAAYDDLRVNTDAVTDMFYRGVQDVRHNRDSFDDYTVQCLYKQGSAGMTMLLDKLGFKKAIQKKAMLGTIRVEHKPLLNDNSTSRALVGLYKLACVLDDAVEEVQEMSKYAAYHMGGLTNLNSFYNKAVLSGKLNKVAVSGADAIKAGASAGITTTLIPSMLGMGVAGGAGESIANTGDRLTQMLDAASEGESYTKLLDADFINEDRRVKNLDAWAEVASDPSLSKYDLPELYAVTKKVIGSNLQFERPDMRNMLIDTVAQVMAQGGRVGLGLHGSTAKTMSDLAKERGNSISGNTIEQIKNSPALQGAAEGPRAINVLSVGREFSDAMNRIPGHISKLTGDSVEGLVNAGEYLVNLPTDDQKFIKAIKEQQEMAKAENALRGMAKDKVDRMNSLKRRQDEAQQAMAEEVEKSVIWKANEDLAAMVAVNKDIRNEVLNNPSLKRTYRKAILADPGILKSPAKRALISSSDILIDFPNLLDAMAGNTKLTTAYSSSPNAFNQILRAAKFNQRVYDAIEKNPSIMGRLI